MVTLDDVAGTLQLISNEMRAYYDREADEFVYHVDEEWVDEFGREQNRLIEADEAANPPGERRYIPLPTSFDVDDWRIMRDFGYSRENDEQANQLLEAIDGRGAFRYFKDTVHRLGIADEWYAYRHKRYTEIAREWCDECGIEVAS